MLERDFQAKLIKELKLIFPECIVLKNDANYIQGFPDLLVLLDHFWVALECKRSLLAIEQDRNQNQGYYVNRLNNMCFAKFICPENKEDVLNDIQQAYRANRMPRISRCK